MTVFAAGRGRVEAEAPRVVWLADGGAAGFPGLKARVTAMPLRCFGLALWLARVRRELTRRGPFDRIIAHWIVPGALPLIGLDSADAALEVVVHGSDARLLAALPRVGSALLSSLLERNTVFRCVSTELGELLQTMTRTSLGDRLRIEPALLELDDAPDRARARTALGIDVRQRLAVVVARLVPEKRVAEALRAAQQIEDLNVVVIGDGPLRSRLASEFPRVHFIGQLPRPSALSWIAAADVLLSASRSEGAPSAVREARALGVPVAACSAGDLAIWAERDPGLFVVP